MRLKRTLGAAAHLAAIVVLTFAVVTGQAQAQRDGNFPVAQLATAERGMVVAQEAQAARIGVDVLKRGGNAVDAAVATGFALAVTYPRAGNLGGGGFMIVHLAKDNRAIAIDYRETAPAATTRDVFLNENGEADPKKSRESGLGIGVPGTVAGLAHAHAKYGSGKFTLAQLIAPAAALAHDGFVIDGDLADTLPSAKAILARWPSSAKIFLKADGNVLSGGDRLLQNDLANSLDAIARSGASAFYQGAIAEKIATAVRDAGGRMTAEDLKNYRVKERVAVRGSYHGYDIVSMPPPSSGGVHLIQILNILEGYDLAKGGPLGADTLHLMVEAMKRAYADRAAFLGDPDFVRVPVKSLISKSYAVERRAEINPEKATSSAEIAAGKLPAREGDNTTHFSVIDSEGNAVSNTYTLNLSYGNGLVAEGTGILLNNELDDFAAKPGAANFFGLTGGDANAPGPNKRPLSSMTPTIVLKDGKPVLITGTPGGSRIITTVLQIVLNVIDHQMDIAQAVTAPRIHHQWLPDEVRVEVPFPEHAMRALEARGHKVVKPLPLGSANSILIKDGKITGAADPRTRGALAIGY